jgi:TM2 domain-containing membrane protein YozV
MTAAAIIINFFLPGVGSLIIGKVGSGIAQLLLYFVGVLFSLTVIGVIIGGPMMLAAWIWGLVTAATYEEKPVQVQVVPGDR